MPMSHRAFSRALCALGAALLLSCALATAQEEGKEFRRVVPPQPTGNPGRIEVVEFFSYACPHCAHFYPLLESWRAKLPGDVVLRRVPVGFNRQAWINLQGAYYALEASGDLARLDGALFSAIHDKHEQIFDEPSLADWVAKNGGNSDKFAAAYVSFGINSQTVHADEMAEKFGIDSVPSMAVNGEYVAIAAATGEEAHLHELIVNTDKLIARVRSERVATSSAAKPAAAGR